MSVNVVRRNDESHTSYLKSAALGALTGYALKYMLPLTPQEKDDTYVNSLKELKDKAKNIRLAEIEAIRKKEHKSEAEEVFLKIYDAKKLKNLGDQNLSEHLLSKVIEIRAKVNNDALRALNHGKKTLEALTKSIRPTSVFVLIGAAIGILAAFGNNILYSTSGIEVDD